MQDAFVDRNRSISVECGLQQRQRGGLVLRFQCGAELPNLVAQPRSVDLILFVAFLDLA